MLFAPPRTIAVALNLSLARTARGSLAERVRRDLAAFGMAISDEDRVFLVGDKGLVGRAMGPGAVTGLLTNWQPSEAAPDAGTLFRHLLDVATEASDEGAAAVYLTDRCGRHDADQLAQAMARAKHPLRSVRLLVLGLGPASRFAPLAEPSGYTLRCVTESEAVAPIVVDWSQEEVCWQRKTSASRSR